MSWLKEAVSGVTIELFNTETRQKEPLKLNKPPYLSLYTCGPTVYGYAHIGNFRTYVFEDLLRRTLLLLGYDVEHVMNLTDVDDKTIKGALKLGTTLDAYTRPFKDAFFEDLKTLNILPAHHYPEATGYIPQMIDVIQSLIDKGFAYKGHDGSIYYSLAKFPRYGCLSHLKLDELQAGASERVANDEYDKENVADFVLWKAYQKDRDGEIFWESPFGKGRPGWHLECSVMAMTLLGETIDVHVGGVDNIFPHHENEIAQSEGYTGHRFVNLWMHSEHLVVDGRKMSKSLGNFYTLRDLTGRGFSGDEIRYMLLHTHYRSQLNFTFQELDAVRTSLERLHSFARRLKETESSAAGGVIAARLNEVARAFVEALADDLNISEALGVLFDWVRETNLALDEGLVSKEELKRALELLEFFNSILAVVRFEEAEIPEALKIALEKRELARATRDFAQADLLRKEILSKGFRIEDTAQGPRLVKA